MSVYVRPDELVPGDVISVGPGASWRQVTGIREPSHALAGAYGAVVVETVLWGDGCRMSPWTRFPGDLVDRVRSASD